MHALTLTCDRCVIREDLVKLRYGGVLILRDRGRCWRVLGTVSGTKTPKIQTQRFREGPEWSSTSRRYSAT